MITGWAGEWVMTGELRTEAGISTFCGVLCSSRLRTKSVCPRLRAQSHRGASIWRMNKWTHGQMQAHQESIFRSHLFFPALSTKHQIPPAQTLPGRGHSPAVGWMVLKSPPASLKCLPGTEPNHIWCWVHFRDFLPTCQIMGTLDKMGPSGSPSPGLSPAAVGTSLAAWGPSGQGLWAGHCDSERMKVCTLTTCLPKCPAHHTHPCLYSIPHPNCLLVGCLWSSLSPIIL